MTAMSDWLHNLPAAQLLAVREFRAIARSAYPEDSNPIERAIRRWIGVALDYSHAARILDSIGS